jgi:hypothetical protein
VVNATPRPLYPQERDPVHIVQEVGWTPGLVWMDVENLASTGIWSPDNPTHSESYTDYAILAYNLCFTFNKHLLFHNFSFLYSNNILIFH